MSLPFVLVHGAWCDSRVWKRVAPLLEARGHRVAAPDLPGCGANAMPFADITLASYVDEVVRALESLPGRALLVGHSLGGLFISQAAERACERVAGLVYLSAFMLRDGESRLAVAHLDPDSVALKQRSRAGEDLVSFTPEAFRQVFAQDASPEDAARLVEKIPPLPTKPLGTPLALTPERYGRVARWFVKCLRDRAITPAFQDLMIGRSPVRKVYELDAGHMPTLSHAAPLATILLDVARQAE